MFQPLLISAGVLACSVLCYAMTAAIIVGLVERVLRGGLGDPGFWKSAAVMMIVKKNGKLEGVLRQEHRAMKATRAWNSRQSF